MSPRIALATLVALALLGGSGPVWAQTYGTLPDSIPDRYVATAIDRSAYEETPSAVVRLDARRLVVEDRETSTLYVRTVVTVLDEDGRGQGVERLWYGHFRTIEDLEGRVLDAQGREIKALDDDNLNDRSLTGGSLYTESRLKIARLFSDAYPYTVEYRYEVEITSPLVWPTWRPLDADAPTELAQFELDVPSSLTVRHEVRRDSLAPTVRTTEERRVTRWRVAGRPAYHREPHGPRWRVQAPSVDLAPSSFETAGMRGDMSTWTAFGHWYHRLKDDRDALAPDAAQRMRQVVEGAATTRDSVRRLYRHVQDQTRYVSVQLGIGGWQPFPTSYVRRRGYGDCKALTNYMEASLEAVGIRAHPVLIERAVYPEPVPRDFPSPTFNHVVLAVPLARDTLWLETTDTAPPFGQIGVDIEDRYGLMVTPEGGTLVRTPGSRASDNGRRRTATVRLSPNGSGTASVRTAYTGNQQTLRQTVLAEKSARERKTWLRERIDVPSFTLSSVDVSAVDTRTDTMRLPFEVDLPRYASKTGSRLFLPLNLTSRWPDVPPAMEAPRTQPIRVWPYPFVAVDSIRYVLPADYAVEAAPEPVVIETAFARYEARVERTEGALVYRRRLEVRRKRLPPEQYEAFRTFFRRVVEADDAQAVLVEQES